MTPRITIGKGITGAVNYARGEGRDPVTRELNRLAPGEESRVEFFGGVGFGFTIASAEDVELARKIMEHAALNQKGKCRLDCVHLSLSWRPGETPTPEHMQEQVNSALAAIGMANAQALYFSHRDEDYRHIHIVASKINPETGYAYDLKGNYLQLSSWAQQYEAEHGGIVSLRRAINNELRAAIDARDAGAVLEMLTKQRPTVTEAQVDAALAKRIKDQDRRRDFTAAILSHETAVALVDDVPRYTTRAVLEAEAYVSRAADNLHNDRTHGLDDRQRAKILDGAAYRSMTAEQANAFRHVTAPEGLALIDGQAGTGKSFTIAAVRAAYEAAGCKVVGLGPTNPVAEDMKADGFRHAATIHSELFALNNGRRQWDAKTVVIVDEAAMIDTKLMAMLTAWASDTHAKIILVGDDRQLSSIDHGGMFGALKDRYGAAELSEVKRQHKHDERRASEMMAEGNFHDALHIYDAKGAIHWTRTQGEARAQLVAQWAKDSAAQPDKTRFVLAVTNDDVNQLNAALRDVRQQRGELGAAHELDTAHGRFAFAVGDRLQFTGTDKKAGIHNGRAGTIAAIDGTHLAVTLDGRKPKTINFDAANFAKFRHGYAGTVYKAQGKTLDQTYLYHSEHWRSAGSYVALTRHREQTALFVARNTAKDVATLARQMSRTDERRAASMFHTAAPIHTPPLTAPEILARFSADMAPPRKDPTMQTPPTAEPAAEDVPPMREAWRLLEEEREQQAAAGSGAPAFQPSGDVPAMRDVARFLEWERQQREAAASGQSAAAEQPEADEWSPSRAFIEEAANQNETQAATPQAAPAAQPEAREAWQQPAFSYDTIKADPWTAVYLAVPDNASPALLNVAYNAASRCIEAVEGSDFAYPDAAPRGPLMPQQANHPEDLFAAADMRRDELHAMLYPIGAPAAEAPRRERIAALEAQATTAAQEIAQPMPEPQRPEAVRPTPQETAAEARQTPEAVSAPIPAPEAATPATAAQSGPQAENSAEALPPLYKRPEAVSPLRGLRHFLEDAGERIASVFHFLADVISPPPPPTAAEVHDRLQASAATGNLEAQAAEAAAVAAQENAAAHDWMQHEARRAQNETNLSFADRYGLPPTSEATLSPAPEADLEPD